jgi:hypothetical protein
VHNISTLCGLQDILQCTVCSTVNSVGYCTPYTALLAMAARIHTFEPRSFRLLHMMLGYKHFILHTHCVPPIYEQYVHLTRSLTLVLHLSHAPHRRRLKYGNWGPLGLHYNDFL